MLKSVLKYSPAGFSIGSSGNSLLRLSGDSSSSGVDPSAEIPSAAAGGSQVLCLQQTADLGPQAYVGTNTLSLHTSVQRAKEKRLK